MATNTQLRVADAKNRAWRTFLQGLAFDVGLAVVLLLLPAVSTANSLADFNWPVLAFSLGKTVVHTALSYVMRVYLDKKGVTPLPKEDPGPPAEPTEIAHPRALDPSVQPFLYSADGSNAPNPDYEPWVGHIIGPVNATDPETFTRALKAENRRREL